jgi:hypothetical protein
MTVLSMVTKNNPQITPIAQKNLRNLCNRRIGLLAQNKALLFEASGAEV